MFTEHDKALVAELKGMPGFQILLALFEAHETGLASDIAKAVSRADLLKAATLYQNFRYVREFLQSGPEYAERELAELKAAQLAQLETPLDPWLARFGSRGDIHDSDVG